MPEQTDTLSPDTVRFQPDIEKGSRYGFYAEEQQRHVIFEVERQYIDGFEARARQAEQLLTNTVNSLLTLTQQVQDLQTRVTALETSVQDLQTRVTALEPNQP